METIIERLKKASVECPQYGILLSMDCSSVYFKNPAFVGLALSKIKSMEEDNSTIALIFDSGAFRFWKKITHTHTSIL